MSTATSIRRSTQRSRYATPNEGGDAFGDGNLTLNPTTNRLPSSSARWSTTPGSVSGSQQHYGASIKDALDYYNNTGAGFAIDRDTGLPSGSLAELATKQAYRPLF